MRRSKIARLVVVAALLATVLTAGPADAARRDSGADGQIEFAGHTWTVKQPPGRVGPGPNAFSGDGVWVDQRGRLHLTIEERNGVWYASEVILDEPLGHGRYTFEVQSRLGRFDPNVVLGMFTWDSTGGPYNRELDIEVSRFGNPADSTNAGFTVQPYNEPGHVSRFNIDARRTTHSIDWQDSQVSFSVTDKRRRTIAAWDFTDGAEIPDPGNAQARINLWLFRGQPPTDGERVEVVISDFRFEG